MRATSIHRSLLLLALIAGLVTAMAIGAGGGPALAAGEPSDPTPPRLSYVYGSVSLLRPGAADWAPAALNTPLTAGDQLYAGPGSSVEIQIGARAFVRAGAGSQLGLAAREPDYVQFHLTEGHVALDLRALGPGHTVELDTPYAALTVERPGYYRIDVAQDDAAFIARRGGQATLTPAGGQSLALAANQQIVLRGATAGVETYAAADLDAWDRWNYELTDRHLQTVSSRYVSPDVYGIDELDRHGAWRVVPTYGSVWVPSGVAPDWAPYTTGRWIWDPYYGWTWVDQAPWGWAPYHYGRWVFVDRFWAWAPGPVIARPVYSPALVAFFGGGGPALGWVALSWGEPVVPWWGRPGFIGAPHWLGWGGPRFVNNVVVSRTTVVNVTQIKVYRNVTVRDAVVVVDRDRFGHEPVARARMRNVDARGLVPIHGLPPVRPTPASLVAAPGAAVRPPEALLERRVVVTRPPRDATPRLHPESPRVVTPARPTELVPDPRARRGSDAPGRQAAPGEAVREAPGPRPGSQPPAAVRPQPAPARPVPPAGGPGRLEPAPPRAAPPVPPKTEAVTPRPSPAHPVAPRPEAVTPRPPAHPAPQRQEAVKPPPSTPRPEAVTPQPRPAHPAPQRPEAVTPRLLPAPGRPEVPVPRAEPRSPQPGQGGPRPESALPRPERMGRPESAERSVVQPGVTAPQPVPPAVRPEPVAPQPSRPSSRREPMAPQAEPRVRLAPATAPRPSPVAERPHGGPDRSPAARRPSVADRHAPAPERRAAGHPGTEPVAPARPHGGR